MTTPLKTAAALAVLALAAAGPVAAHHSTAMYDKVNLKQLSGTVKSVQWSNPHVIVEFVADAKDDPAKRTWRIEASSPGVMNRAGWTKRTLNPGDQVTFFVAPMRNGESGGEMRRVTLANGTTLNWSFKSGEKVGIE